MIFTNFPTVLYCTFVQYYLHYFVVLFNKFCIGNVKWMFKSGFSKPSIYNRKRSDHTIKRDFKNLYYIKLIRKQKGTARPPIIIQNGNTQIIGRAHRRETQTKSAHKPFCLICSLNVFFFFLYLIDPDSSHS